MKLIVRYMFLLLLAGLGFGAEGQRIVAMRIDSTHCVGDSLRVSVGYGDSNDVVVENPRSSVSHPQHTFLPDGQVCDSVLGSCTYRSPIRFMAFDVGSMVTSAQDIDFVRINIEHSFMGDVIIALECPNGQFAALKYSQLAPSGCGDSKFDSLYRAECGGFGTWFGEAVPEMATDPCDSSEYGNRAGVGWNYCFSESLGHVYGGQDGMIYNSDNWLHLNAYNHNVVDSTHIAAGTHFYHPQESFSQLVGCPLNGTWNIVVQDNWGRDNGWLFDWELSIDPAMYVPPHMASVALDGEEVDSVFVLAPPQSDTTIGYGLRVVLSCGDTIDTVFAVHWTEPFADYVVDTLCQGDTARWKDLVFVADTVVDYHGTRMNGCDSVVNLSYTFMPTYYLHDTLPYCANEPFLYEGIDYGGPTTVVVPHATQWGCDSTVTVHLVTIDSLFHLQLQMSADGVLWSEDTVLYGCQPMTVWLRDTTLFEQWRRWTFGDGDTLLQMVTAFQEPQPFAHTYDSAGFYTLTLTAESIHGCVDSAVFRKEVVRVYVSPEADFTWSPLAVVSHDPKTQFVNLSSPIDSLEFEWRIPNGTGGCDTFTELNPFYRWPVGSSDVEVTLSATWTHVIDDTLTLECIDTAVRQVKIINEYLQFPNVVTPNGDGINDRWEVVNLIECGLYKMSELWIYNRWGTLVYHVRDIDSEDDFWDPSDYPDGTYFFRFSAKSYYGLVRCNGVIEVVR